MSVQSRHLIQKVPDLMKQKYGDYPPSVTMLAKATGLTRPTVKAWITNRELETYSRRALLAWGDFFGVSLFHILTIPLTAQEMGAHDESL